MLPDNEVFADEAVGRPGVRGEVLPYVYEVDTLGKLPCYEGTVATAIGYQMESDL